MILNGYALVLQHFHECGITNGTSNQATVSNRLRRLPTIACSDNRFHGMVLKEKIIIFVDIRMRSL